MNNVPAIIDNFKLAVKRENASRAVSRSRRSCTDTPFQVLKSTCKRYFRFNRGFYESNINNAVGNTITKFL